jgi:Protein of unknown function (DUF3179)
MNNPLWLRVIGLAVLTAAPLAGQQPREENRPPMPFVPLLEPRFIPAAKADFLKDGDRVVGVSENGVSKAYQPKVLAFHHVVQDNLKELPIIATWCALCNTPLVYKREVDGKTLTFQRAGNRGNNFFMVDAETNSHWQQIGGECFDGPMKGKRLTMVPFLYTTWGEWRSQHSETLVLIPEAAYQAGYDFMDKNRVSVVPYGSDKKPDRDLIRQEDKRLPNYEQVIGIEVGNTHKAYPVSALRKQTALNDAVGGEPVLLVYAAASDTTTAFSRTIGGRALTFHAADGGIVVDRETASKWTAYGECVAGKLKGQKLNRIIPQPGSWFAWAEFFPDTEVYSSGAH